MRKRKGKTCSKARNRDRMLQKLPSRMQYPRTSSPPCSSVSCEPSCVLLFASGNFNGTSPPSISLRLHNILPWIGSSTTNYPATQKTDLELSERQYHEKSATKLTMRWNYNDASLCIRCEHECVRLKLHMIYVIIGLNMIQRDMFFDKTRLFCLRNIETFF